MRKFNITIGSSTREVNANEYNTFPKTGHFEATINGAKGPAATTSGKGKSAVNNHYVYFKEGSQIFYFKSDAVEVVAAQKGFLATSEAALGETVANPLAVEKDAGTTEPMAALMTELSKPVGKRQRVNKTAA